MSNRLLRASAIVIVLFISASAQAGSIIKVTGFNQDLIAENNATGPQSGSTTEYSGWVFNEQGAPSQPPTRGFATNRFVTTVNGSSVAGSTFQLAPYSAGANVLSNNVLRVALADAPSARELTFDVTQQTGYYTLQFLTVNQGAGAGTSWNAIVRFTDNTTSTYTVATNRADWTVAPSSSVFRYDTSGVISRSNNDWADGNYGAGIYIYEDSISLTLADRAKTVAGVQFDVTSTTGVGIAVFAINGEPVPEPASALLLGNGAIGLAIRSRRAR